MLDVAGCVDVYVDHEVACTSSPRHAGFGTACTGHRAAAMPGPAPAWRSSWSLDPSRAGLYGGEDWRISEQHDPIHPPIEIGGLLGQLLQKSG